MKPVNFLIYLSLVAVNFGAFAQKMDRRELISGRHDGGGQAVVQTNGSVDIADRFPPRGSAAVYKPAGEAVDVLQSKEVRDQIQVVDKLLNQFALRHRAEPIPLAEMIKAKEYYFVESLPDVPDCKAPRDNSGVPIDAEVFHIACTQNALKDVTFLLVNNKFDFRKLSKDRQVDTLVHEALRSWKVRLDTYSVEIIVNGLSHARDLYYRQLAGERLPLTNLEYSALTQLQTEIFQTPLALDRSDKFSIARNGGGLIINIKGHNIDSSVFLGTGTVISTAVALGKNVEILRSTINSNYQNQNVTNKISSNVKILDSNLTISGSEILSQTQIVNSDISSRRYPKIGSNVKIKDSKLDSLQLVIRNDVKLNDVKLEDPNLAIIEAEVLMTNVRIDYPATDKTDSGVSYADDAKGLIVRIGTKTQIHNTIIGLTDNLEVGANASIRNVNLRVRPFTELASRFTALASVKIADHSQIVSDNRPVIFLSEWTMFGSNLLTFAGSINFTKMNLCKNMGYTKSTYKETGISFTELKITEKSDLNACKETEPVRLRHCSKLDGCYGYYEANDFVNLGDTLTVDAAFAKGCSDSNKVSTYVKRDGYHRRAVNYEATEQVCHVIEKFAQENKGCQDLRATAVLKAVPGQLNAVYQIQSVSDLRVGCVKK